jgi:serine/threonine-protein kinase HipA
MRQLNVWLNQQRIGVLSEGDNLWEFEYDEAWATSAEGFSLAPGLPRETLKHVDGGSNRPVQWYFDNLLPEENLRLLLLKEAGIHGGDDAFALLAYLGAESAGSLSLLPPGPVPQVDAATRLLIDDDLSSRIRNLPREPLSKTAPKRMSLAGAQNKLPVIRAEDGALFEPIGNEPSTHILKPNHMSDDYAASVMNEFFVMTLAGRVGLPVPKVFLHRVPEPVYVVERFDRVVRPGSPAVRRHIIDACQLLNKSRMFKTTATTDTLAAVIAACRNRAQARRLVFRWLVFCALTGNDDNHLKNLSFHIDPTGISMAPHYDLLSTATYATKAMADHRAVWPHVPMTIPHPGAETFAEVSRQSLVQAAAVLGLPARMAERLINELVVDLPRKARALVDEIESGAEPLRNARPEDRAIETRVLRTVLHIVIPDMAKRLSS